MKVQTIYTKRNNLELEFTNVSKTVNKLIDSNANQILILNKLNELDKIDSKLLNVENEIFLQLN